MANDELKADLEIGGIDEALADLKAKLSAGFNDVKIGAGFSKEITSELLGAEKRALSLQSSLKSLAATDSKGKALDWISRDAQKSQKEIAGVNRQLQTIQKLAAQTNSKSLLEIYEDDAKRLAGSLDAAEKKMLRLQQARLNKGTPNGAGGSGAGGGFAGGLADATGLPLTAAGAGLAVGAGVIAGGAALVSTAKAGERATLQLGAAAKQAGESYDKLNQSNAEFARLTGQSEQASKGAFASLVEFSKQAGRTDQIDKFSKSIADLFAAKGIENEKLPDMLSQLKTGQDEVFDRLAGANPSKFYNEFASSIGTTADKLTDAQKAQVRFDTILKLSLLFDGSAEKRLKEMSGQLDSVAAGFENLYNRAGKAVAPFVKQQLENITNLGDFFAGKGLFASEDEKQRLRDQVKKDSDERAKIIADGLRDSEKKIAEAQKNPTASAENFRLSFIDQTKFSLASVAKEIEEIRADGTKLIRMENQGEVAARLQAIKDEAAKAADAEIKGYQESFERVLADKNSSIDLLQLARKSFENVQNVLPKEVSEKLRREFADSISSGVAKGFEQTLSAVDVDAAKLVAGLKKLQAGVAGLLPEASKKLINDYQKALESMSNQAIALRDSVKEAMVATVADNQLLKLMLDVESATDRAAKKFGKYGDDFVKKMAEMDRAFLQSQINKILYQGSKSALKSEQEADRLGMLPESSIGGFQRNLGMVGTEADYNGKSLGNRRAREDAEYYANQYNPNNPKSAFQNRFGNNVSAFNGESRQILEEIEALQKTDLRGTGAAGKGLLAEKIDKAITIPLDQLLSALQSGGETAANAQKLLDAKASVAKDIQKADEQKFKDAVAIDVINQKSVSDAEALIKNLGSSGLNDPDKVKELISIIGEVPEAERTPALIKAQREALRADAVNTRQKAKDDAKQAKIISDTMDLINKQLTGTGLKTTFSETPIVDIEIRDVTLSATQNALGTRANGSNVAGLNQ